METSIVQVHRGGPEVLGPLAEMIDTVYRPQLRAGEGMSREFPHVFTPENAQNLYYAMADGKPVSMVAVFPQQVMMHGITLEVASIGLVATLPAFQGRRISSAILERVVSDLTAARVPLMLVSGERGLYSRIHCIPVGNMFQVEWTGSSPSIPANSSSATRLRVVDVPKSERSQWAARLAAVYRSEAFRYRRTDKHMELLLNALWSQRNGYNQRLLVLLENEIIVGYVVGYTTKKRPDVVEIMEWAGSRVALVELLDTVRASFDAQSVRFRVHRTDFTMRTLVSSLGLTMTAVPLQGTVRMLDVKAFFSSLAPVFQERFGATGQVLQENDVWTVTVGERHIVTNRIEELAAWVFDSTGDRLGVEFVHTDDLNYI